MFRNECAIAWRFLSGASRKGLLSFTTWLSIGGITIGVAATGLVTGVFNGFITKLSEVVVSKMGHLTIVHRGGMIESVQNLESRIRPSLPTGSTLEPFGWVDGMAASKGAALSATIEGVADESWKSLRPFALEPGEDQPTSLNGVWLGEALAQKLKVVVGDTIQLVVSEPAGNGVIVPRSRAAKVERILALGMQEYDGKIVLMPLQHLREWLRWTAEATLARVRLPTHADQEIESVRERVEDVLGSSYALKTWKELHHNFFASIVIEKFFLSVVVGIIVFVSLFNVVSTLYLLVSEKIKDLSILRAMGASARFLQRVFLLHGFLFGFLGATAGLALALVLSWILREVPIIQLPRDVYNLGYLPIEIRPLEWLALWGVTIALAIAAALFPSTRARRLSPVEGLRYE